MPVHAAGIYGILQTPGGQGAFLRLAWDSGFLFSWEVTKSHEVLAMFVPTWAYVSLFMGIRAFLSASGTARSFLASFCEITWALGHIW
jgi:hypothetical protein